MASFSAGRLTHLWKLAVQCAEKNPALSRFYLNELSSSSDYESSTAFAMKFCQHCCEFFTVQNCCVRVLPKRKKNKKQKQKRNKDKERKDCDKKQGEWKKLPRKLNHVGVVCKACGKQSFFKGQQRSRAIPVFKTRDSLNGTSNQCNDNTLLSTPLNNSVDQDSTPNLSKSGKKRQRRPKAKLKGLLLADEQQKSKSPGASPRLQDFLSSL